MSRLYINPTLQRQIEAYCEANSITDLNAFANRCALQGFSILKYGTSPSDNVSREKGGVYDYSKQKSTKNEGKKSKDAPSSDEGKREIKENFSRCENKEESIERIEGKEEESTVKEPIVRRIKITKKG